MRIISNIILIIGTLQVQAQSSYLLKNVRLFDGFEVIENTDILIMDSTIFEIGENLSKPNAATVQVNGNGKTVIPGLINAHVHAWIPYHLKNAMEAGVFAVLDMHSSVTETAPLRLAKLTEGLAKFYSSGSAATVEGGHGTQYWFEVPVIGGNRSPEEFVNEVLDQGSDYIKIIYEHKRATLSIEQVERVINESHAHSKLAVAHISTFQDAFDVVTKNIDGLVHLWKDSLMRDSFVAEAKTRETFVIPTLTTLQGVINYYAEIEREYTGLSLAILLSEVKKLSQAGILLLAGTDAPNVNLDYGSSLHAEMELFVEAGLTPVEALKTATSNVNAAFSLENFGTIKVGQAANFNLIDGDPTTDITDSKNIVGIWAEGKKIK
ncbi:MAG: amidohydrolase family protein [Cyclobacteriaceae bacterium]